MSDPTRSARRYWLAVLLLLAIAFGLVAPSLAQGDVRTFAETGHSLRGAFRVFWESNGGVGVFGYPISEEITTDDGRLIQRFQGNLGDPRR